jgi:S-methylmethionine-dependent homocysteine/selenocysteine methylase
MKVLPQLDGSLFLTDGGIETSLIYNDGLDLPQFAAIDLLRRPGGEAALTRYYEPYIEIAGRFGAGIILESATWRASSDWGALLGFTPDELAAANRRSIQLLESLRAGHPGLRTVISGCVGPRGDGYEPTKIMTADEARRYHWAQVNTFAGTSAEMVSAMTMNYVEEAIGIAEAAKDSHLPVAISFTVETDGRLPTGQTLGEAVRAVDDATDSYPAYYMLNCAHPEHFREVLRAPWSARIRGLRANASRKSHAELNEAAELDIGDPIELAGDYAELKARRLSRMNVMGGCCGTDHRHVEKIAAACARLFRAAA